MPRHPMAPIVVNEEFLRRVENSWGGGMNYATGRVVMALVARIRELEKEVQELWSDY